VNTKKKVIKELTIEFQDAVEKVRMYQAWLDKAKNRVDFLNVLIDEARAL